MRKLSVLVIGIGGIALLASCSKNDKVVISQPPLQIGQPVSNAAPLTGSIKGTMLSGETYIISGQVTINAGDTLLVQNGVTVYMENNADIVVRGIFLSLGTKDAPNTFTVQGVNREDVPGQDPSTDPAFQGLWSGINADTSCTLLVIKWTHIDYAGAAFTIPPINGYSEGDASDAVFFQNVNGTCVVEDSWIYGCVDEAIKIVSGKISIMRNTFEKCGYQGGNTVNVKSGAVGDVAYNLFMGVGADGITASNKGGEPVQCQINAYNNTFLDCGWRQIEAGKGGSIIYQQGARGMVYNNIIVNCRYGLFLVANPAPDTTNLFYGNNSWYGDSALVTDGFYPNGSLTEPQATDLPNPATYLPAGFIAGSAYDGTNMVGINSPQFAAFTLPCPDFKEIDYVTGFDFHLQSGSPDLGKGYTGFQPLAAVAKDPDYGASDIQGPDPDLGCYPTDGLGNQH